MSTIRRVVGPLILLAVSLMISLGVLEASLRLVYPPPARFLYPQESYEYDPEAGHVLRANQVAFTHDRSVRTNALGVREHDITPEPAPGTIRILALGDSQTFGNGLDLADTWPKQLERDLNRRGARRWEVINAGVPGTDTWQHEIYLRRLAPVTRPHAAVLALYVNDVAPRQDPRQLVSAGSTNTWTKRLVYAAKRSAVVTWTYHRVVLPWSARRAGPGGAIEDAVLRGTTDERAERGWRQVEQSLHAMKSVCDAQHIVLFVAVLPRRDQVSGQLSGQAYIDRASEIARGAGVETANLLPSLQAEYRVRGEALFIPWDGHHSALANRVIAVRLGDLLATLPAQVGPARRP